MNIKKIKSLILLLIVISVIVSTGCTPSIDAINKSLSVRDVKIAECSYSPGNDEFGWDPIDSEGYVSIYISTKLPVGTEVYAKILNEKGEEVYVDHPVVSSDDKGNYICIDYTPYPDHLDMFVNGNYKAILQYNDTKREEKVKLKPVPFTISKGFKNLKLAEAKYDEYLAKKNYKENKSYTEAKVKKKKVYSLRSKTYFSVGKDLPEGRIKITATNSSIAEVTVTTKYIEERYRGFMATRGSNVDESVTLDVEEGDIIMINTNNSHQVLKIKYVD